MPATSGVQPMQTRPLVKHLAVSTKMARFSGVTDTSFRVLMLFMNAQTVLANRGYPQYPQAYYDYCYF